MCGIYAAFGVKRPQAYHKKCATTIAHRGPDDFRMVAVSGAEDTWLAFFRLTIVGNDSGMQPLTVTSIPDVALMFNGEIYNHVELARRYNFTCEGSSDGEVIVHLYARFGAIKTAQLLDGVFAFVIVDMATNQVHFGRDTFGVRPLFLLHSDDDRCYAACSEMKGLIQLRKDLSAHDNVRIEHVLPGHCSTYILASDGRTTLVHSCPYTTISLPPVFHVSVSLKSDVFQNIKSYLIEAVRKRLMGGRRIGCLLSGGLDSSLITALTVRLLREQGYTRPVQTFCIGMAGSEDTIAARKVAHYLGTEHHEVTFDAREAIAEIPTVIRHLEGYDNSTIRGSVCLFLICKYIRRHTDTVVLLSGEGADELAQGYEYFKHAPNAAAADDESRRLLRNMYMYDVLRVDRCTAAHGLELRVPMLDKAFTSYYLSLPPDLRRPQAGIEKYLLRHSFEGDQLIPAEVLWRKKSPMPEGVSPATEGATWQDALHEHFSETVPDKELRTAAVTYPFNTPKTKQALFYRRTFEGHFPGQHHVTPQMWSLKWVDVEDPSIPIPSKVYMNSQMRAQKVA